MADGPVLVKSYAFAVAVVGFVRRLREAREYEIASQLLRAGTSIGANVEEAQAASSRRDFVAKLSIAAKEARESRYWLRLLRDSGICTRAEVAPLIAGNEELIRLLTAIVKTSSGSRGADS
jgi:four helix bundle protein